MKQVTTPGSIQERFLRDTGRIWHAANAIPTPPGGSSGGMYAMPLLRRRRRQGGGPTRSWTR